MPIFSRLIFRVVRWAARRGLREEESFASDGSRPEARSAKKLEARGTGVRGETYAYWYLRRYGYVFVAKNYMPRGIKGELDLIGYDRKTLAFVEVRTRTVKEDAAALPKLSVTREKQRMVIRTAKRFLAKRHVEECPLRFDVVALITVPASPPSCGSTKTPSARSSTDGTKNSAAATAATISEGKIKAETSKRSKEVCS
jgi:putative endonuclease